MGVITEQADQDLRSDEYISPEKSRDYLKEPCHFQSFAKYIDRLVEEKRIDLEGASLPDYLTKAVLDLAPVSKEDQAKIKKFFKRVFKTDKKGEYTSIILDVPREYGLKLCFVFHLNVDESTQFLHKACVTSGFNVRSAYEAVCLYCIKKGQSYQTALDLLRRYEATPSEPAVENEFIGTKSLQSTLKEFTWESNEDFLNTFLIPNRPNYTQYSISTFKTYSELRLSLCQQILDLRAENNHSTTGDLLFIHLKQKLKELEDTEPSLGLCSENLSEWRDVPEVLGLVQAGLKKLYPDEAEERYERFIHEAVSNAHLMNETLDYRVNFPTGEQAVRVQRKLEEQWRKKQQEKAQKNGADKEKKTRKAAEDSQISWRTNSDSTLKQIMYCFPQPKYLNFYEKHPEKTPEAKIRKIIILLYFLDEFFDLFYSGNFGEEMDRTAQPIEQFESWVAREFPDYQTELAELVFSEEQSDGFYAALYRQIISQVTAAEQSSREAPDKKTRREWQYESFYNRLYNLLVECSLPELYPANPFDWLILNSARVLMRLEQEESGPIRYFNRVIESSFPDEKTVLDDIFG